jgi:hypothetical protein
MIALTSEDLQLIQQLASERSSDPGQREELIRILTEGFSLHADEDLITTFGSRTNLFQRRVDWLIENHHYAGQTSEAAFMSDEGRLSIMRMVQSCKVPPRDQDDITADIVVKFWRHRHAEKFNPLRSPWSYHVRNSVKRCVAAFWNSRNRITTEKAFAYQQHLPPASSDDFELEPYEVEQDPSPDKVLVLEEFLSDWEEFLTSQKPFRSGHIRWNREICTLLPPGTSDIPTATPLNLYVVAKGRKNFRVCKEEWLDQGRSTLVDVNRLQDYQAPNAQIRKFYQNPSFKDGSDSIKVERTPIAVYNLLRRGLQVEAIAQDMKVEPSTVYNWVRQLHELFRGFWLISNLIPDEVKHLAIPTYKCAKCRKTMHSFHENGCIRCGADMTGWEKKIRLDVYPWEPVRGTQDIADRAAKYRPALQPTHCKI